MISIRKIIKRGRRRLRRIDPRVLGVVWLLALAVACSALYSNTMPRYINPTAYAPLLETIAEGESNGNYNAYYGQPANTSIKLTEMTIAQLLQWQRDYVRAGNPSSAAGRYQIIQPTLEGLVRELAINQSDVFNEQLQDRMAIALAERRGARDFIENDISADQFAANLAQEWAALPAVTGSRPTESFYAGDGLNVARVSVDATLDAVREFKRLAN